VRFALAVVYCKMGLTSRESEKLESQFKKAPDRWELVLDRNKHPDICPVKFCSTLAPKSYSSNKQDGFICSGCKMRLWRKNNPLQSAYASLKNTAAAAGNEFDLTFSQFKLWCLKVDYLTEKRKNPGRRVSIKRIDLNLGFEEGNLRLRVAAKRATGGRPGSG